MNPPYQVIQGNCLEVLPSIASQSVDAVITDPPYPEISRDYGRLTEAAWWDLMMGVCSEVRRILKPSGSAVFILQPNSEKLGRMRGWLWRFMAWAAEDWNVIQDVYWWNYAMIPEAHAIQGRLMRPSLKTCVWLGSPNCYRDQDSVLWEEAASSRARYLEAKALNEKRLNGPSGQGCDRIRIGEAAEKRGGVTPFNVLPFTNANSASASSSYGHGAGTALAVADWWTRYIVPAGGIVLDPFNGAGTMGIAAVNNGASYIGIEKMPKYVDASLERLAKVQPALVAI